MAIFISYSHADSDFVDRLAANLVQRKAQVWVDRWELNVGDSLLARVQEALQNASALIVILSAASIQSEWCKKEINAGLLRELEERRVVVLPALVQDCDIPLFLRDKLYADFRTDFDHGLKQTLEAIAGVTSSTQGRIETPDFFTDWSLDWFEIEGHFCVQLTFVQQDGQHPYSVLTEVQVICNDTATGRQRQYAEAGVEWFGHQMIVESLAEFAAASKLTVLLEDNHAKEFGGEIDDPKTGIGFQIIGSSRRLGLDTGKDIFVDVGLMLRQVRDAEREALRKPTHQELQELGKIIASGMPK